MRHSLMIGLLLLGGCAAPVVAGNDLGGVVEGDKYSSSTKSFKAAESHCEKYGKKVRVTNSVPAGPYSDSNLTFQCI
jgi:hypothetical protein